MNDSFKKSAEALSLSDAERVRAVKFALGLFFGLICFLQADPLFAFLDLDAPVSYLNGLLVAFGFVIGAWITIIFVIFINWSLKRNQEDSAAKDQEPPPSSVSNISEGENDGAEGEASEASVMMKMEELRGILNGIGGEAEIIDLSAPPEIVKYQAGQLKRNLGGMLSKADRLVENIEEDVEGAFLEQGANGRKGGRPGDEEDPEALAWHVRALKLRAEGRALLAQNSFHEAGRAFEESLELLRGLCKANPGNKLWRRDLILAHHNMGRAKEAGNERREALGHYKEALLMTRKETEHSSGSLDWKRGLAASHSHLGRVMSQLGNLEGAFENFDKEVDIMRHIVKKKPGNKAWQYALASAYHNMGQLLERRGDKGRAIEVYENDRAILKKLADSEPENSAWLYDLACVYGQMARLYKEEGRLNEALSQARRYLGAMRKLTEREPENLERRRELTVALGQVGRLMELSGDYSQALAAFGAALEIRRNLTELAPENSVYQDELLVCLYKIGDVYAAKKEYDAAWRRYKEALDLAEALIGRDGREERWLMGKCGVLLRLGNLHQAHDAAAAANYFRSALVIAEEPHLERDREGDWLELAALIKRSMGAEEGSVRPSARKNQSLEMVQ